MPGPLHDLRVIDLSWGIAGPMTAMLLADQGAQVTKVEPPGGDPFRFQPGYRVWNRGAAHLSTSRMVKDRNFLDLVRRADILIEAFHPGTTQRLRIDWLPEPRQQPAHLLLDYRVRPRDERCRPARL